MRSFFNRLFRCFAPGSAYVVPIVEAAYNGSVESKKLSRVLKQKSQLDTLNSANIETDCVFLMEMIRIEVSAASVPVFRDPTGAVLFSFEDLSMSSAFRSSGGKVPHGISLFRMLIGRTVLRDFNDLHTENDKKSLVLAVSSFLDHLERLYKFSDKKLGIYLSNGSLSHECLIILTVNLFSIL